MKKKLEADLISIAHRILKLKNKSDLAQLHVETQKLYEKLSVLRFVEEHLGDVKPTIGLAEIEEKITAAFDTSVSELAEQSVAEEIPEIHVPAVEDPKKQDAAPEVKSEEFVQTDQKPENEEIPEETPSEKTSAEAPAEEIPEAEFEQPAELAGELSSQDDAVETEVPESEELAKKDDSPFKPAFELSFDSHDDTAKEAVKQDAKDEFKPENTQITFEDILGSHYADPVFVKPEDLEKERTSAPKPDNVIPIGRNLSDSPVISINKSDEHKSYSLNERLSKGITIGLNDRIAFMKHLFNNSSEDYNRVLSQLITFDTFYEAKNFIDNMVKPDYNNWDGKDEYADRFMEIVEKKFS